ncbi:MAG: NAD-dependent epimerase/dehydratase family protein, partial [Gammaproteobacteria bacterium]|nr:NAD-dependent epimerase/dehydratase family protein [Gammaproteobacteria bacterium]
MNILISGSTGLVGSALTEHLAEQGHKIFPLHRNPTTEKQHYWFPDENRIHLAGENIADSRWNQKKKAAILNSRVQGTRLFAQTIAELESKPELFISASAIGYYGDTGDNIVDEDSARGTGFLSDVASQWEAATQAVEDAGIRTIHLRTGIVLSPDGGVLQKMLMPFNMGLGGIVGN